MSETAGLKKVKFIPGKLLSDGLTYLKEQRNEGKWLSLLPLQFHIHVSLYQLQIPAGGISLIYPDFFFFSFPDLFVYARIWVWDS